MIDGQNRYDVEATTSMISNGWTNRQDFNIFGHIYTVRVERKSELEAFCFPGPVGYLHATVPADL